MTEARGVRYLLSPLTLEDFVANYWGRKAVVIKGGPDKFAGLFTTARLREILRTLPPTIDLRLKMAFTDENGMSRSVKCESGQHALDLFDEGGTICATAIERADETLNQWCDAIAAEFLSPDPFLMNIYYSPAGTGFGVHFDSQSVWIAQCDGQKLWRFGKEPSVAFPRVGSELPKNDKLSIPVEGVTLERPDESQLEEVLLTPGDLLYLPAGTWHRGRASEGESMAVTITQPYDNNLAALIAHSLALSLSSSPEFRRHLPSLHHVDGTSLQRWFDERMEDVRRAAAQLSAADLFREWYRLASARLPEAAKTNEEPLEPGASLRGPSAGIVARDIDVEGEAAIELLYGGAAVTVAREAEPIVDLLRSGRTFTAERTVQELGDGLEWADVEPLLRDLEEAGMVTRS